MQSNLAEAIREAIRASGQSAGQLGASSGVDKAIITRFLRDERSITVETAEKLLAALGCVVTVKRVKAGAPAPPDRPKKRAPGAPVRKPPTPPAKGR
jgi:transcriptional regulator with XRE-family HTH domain